MLETDIIMRKAIFHDEIEMIRDNDMRQLAVDCLAMVPEYFFHIPASSTGKHHPAYTLGEGGLVRHTKATIKIAVDLLSLEQNKNMDQDSVIVALILHDAFKNGLEDSGHTKFNHPLLAAELVSKWAEDHQGLTIGTMDRISDIVGMISAHMGQWNINTSNKDPFESTKLPKPIMDKQKFVHMCDYLASRRYLMVDMEEDNEV